MCRTNLKFADYRIIATNLFMRIVSPQGHDTELQFGSLLNTIMYVCEWTLIFALVFISESFIFKVCEVKYVSMRDSKGMRETERVNGRGSKRESERKSRGGEEGR